MLYFKLLHLRVTLFSRPLIMHPSSKYLIRGEKMKQHGAFTAGTSGSFGIEPSWPFHHPPETRWAWYQTAFRCHSRTTALLRKWNKAIKGNNWVVPSLLAARTWTQHERHKSNCQSVEERWIWLHSKDHWLWACSRKGCECLCGLLGERWICACLSQNGGPAVGYRFWRVIHRRAGSCEFSVWFDFMTVNCSV